MLDSTLVLEPDVITCHYTTKDKTNERKDCLNVVKEGSPSLLMALNFKNPPGRLLRRQWTHPLSGLPDFHYWRMFKDQLILPKVVVNIP